MEKKTEKKSLSVEELAKKIVEVGSTEEGCRMSETELQNAIREKGFSFAKDKWNKALDIALESCCEECAGCSADECEAEDFVADFFKDLKSASLTDDKSVFSLTLCPSARPEVFRLLDLACEAGLLEKVIGFKLSEDALKYFKEESEKEAKGKKEEKK